VKIYMNYFCSRKKMRLSFCLPLIFCSSSVTFLVSHVSNKVFRNRPFSSVVCYIIRWKLLISSRCTHEAFLFLHEGNFEFLYCKTISFQFPKQLVSNNVRNLYKQHKNPRFKISHTVDANFDLYILCKAYVNLK